MRLRASARGPTVGAAGSRRDQRGSVLALVPAGFLVLMLLAGLAVDSAVTYEAQHALHDALTAAANDAVSAGLDSRAFYAGGAITLDPATVAVTVCRSVEAQDLAWLHRLQLAVAVGNRSVRVEGTATVNAVFGRLVPGFGSRQVSSSADATLTAGGQPAVPALGPATPIACG